MSIYPSPKTRNGTLNTIFNNKDYIQVNTGGASGLTISQTDAKYLQISGVASSSAQTTFQNTVNFKSLVNVDYIKVNTLATIKDITTTRTAQTLSSANFTASQSYSFNNGMIYSLASNNTPITSLSILNIPTTPLQTYKFTFIIEPNVKSSPFYLKPTSNNISINKISVPLFGLDSVLLPSSYTYLVQEITIMNKSPTSTPSFVALTNILGYEETIQTTLLIAGGDGTTNLSYSDDNGITWKLPNNQPFTSRCYGRSAFDGKIIVMGGNSNIAYSDDYGITWISTGFNLITTVYQIIYIPETKMWFAVGNSTSNQTMARSSDGINWTLLSTTIFDGGREYNIIYNGSVYIAVGYSNTYPMATSSDGITWEYNTNYKLDTAGLQTGLCLIFDGSRYIFAGGASPTSSTPTSSNIVISQDGITWDDTNKIYLPFDIRAIAYNGVDTYVACGEKNGYIDGTIFPYWSNDLINWTPANNNLIGNSWFMVWNGTYFVIGGAPLSGSTVNVIYSTDGKDWTASTNSQLTSNVWGISSITY